MPLYEYICKDCEKLFEKFFPTAAEAEGPNAPECPHCNSTEVMRILSSFCSSSSEEGSCGTGRTSFG